MYAFVRQQLDDSKGRSWSGSDVQLEGVNHVSYKCKSHAVWRSYDLLGG